MSLWESHWQRSNARATVGSLKIDEEAGQSHTWDPVSTIQALREISSATTPSVSESGLMADVVRPRSATDLLVFRPDVSVLAI